jgi:hypothetical protein
MTPLNFVGICSVPIVAGRMAVDKLPASDAQSKHASRLLAAGAGMAQSKARIKQ